MKLITALFTFSAGISSILSVNASLASESLLHFKTPNLKLESKAFTFCQGSNIFDRNVLDLNSEVNPVEVISESKVLSYGDNFSYNLQPNSTWLIKNATTQATLVSGTGSISNFNFSTPGDYIVEVTEVISCGPGECEHAHDPDLISIYVSPHKMTFDFSTLDFQEPIIGGMNYTDLEVNVVVNYENYFNQNATIPTCSVRSAGVQTTFFGNVDPGFQSLNLGPNEVLYKISGQATKDTYIMFDFIDINNQVVSYYYPTKIN